MKTREKEPFKPFVTVDDIVNFNIDDEGTYTESRFVNAVLRAMYRVGAADTHEIESFLGMEKHMINHGVRIACGFTLTFLRAIVTIKMAARIHVENPGYGLEEIALSLGYGSRSSIWNILNKKKYADLTRRLCPDLLKQKHYKTTSREELERLLSRKD